jgi:hypothetical protein
MAEEIGNGIDVTSVRWRVANRRAWRRLHEIEEARDVLLMTRYGFAEARISEATLCPIRRIREIVRDYEKWDPVVQIMEEDQRRVVIRRTLEEQATRCIAVSRNRGELVASLHDLLAAPLHSKDGAATDWSGLWNALAPAVADGLLSRQDCTRIVAVADRSAWQIEE